MRILILIGLVVTGLFWEGGRSPIWAQSIPLVEEPLIRPLEEEAKIDEAQIDTEFLEIDLFYGIYAFENFSASGVYGVRVAYHLTEDVFFEASMGMTRIDQETIQRVTGRQLVSDENVLYWNAVTGYNLFPGQIFWSKSRTINSSLFLVGGAGQTRTDNDNHFTLILGTGYKFFITDYLDIRIDFRDHIFETDILAEKERVHNLEGTFGLGFFF